jgi:hypothetical protein
MMKKRTEKKPEPKPDPRPAGIPEPSEIPKISNQQVDRSPPPSDWTT